MLAQKGEKGGGEEVSALAYAKGKKKGRGKIGENGTFARPHFAKKGEARMGEKKKISIVPKRGRRVARETGERKKEVQSFRKKEKKGGRRSYFQREKEDCIGREGAN